jgi:hypothetical protein
LAPSDVEIAVEEGIAVDQYGRAVVVRSRQCGRIGAWIAEEERRAAAEGSLSPLATHRSPSGDVTVYVVASYGSCEDALVPIPGKPCGRDEEVMAPSRIRDSWTLEFRWAPPAMPSWDGIRRLADLLLGVELDDVSSLASDEEALAAHVRALAPGSPPPTVALPSPPLLPRVGARAALDRLVTLWLTEVRPLLLPHLLAPAGDAGVLLSAVTVVPAVAFDAANPVVEAFHDPDDEGRPYLAPTQLIQELELLGGGLATIVTGSPIERPPSRPQVELASLGEGGTGAGRHLLLWFHLADPVELPATVAVRRNGGAPVDFRTRLGADSTSWILQPPAGAPLVDFELLSVDLRLPAIEVRNDATATRVRLTTYLDRVGLDVLGRVGDVVTLYEQVDPSPPPLPELPSVPPPKEIRDVVTVTPSVNGEMMRLELWFHVDKEPFADEMRVRELDQDAIIVLAESEDAQTPVQLKISEMRQVRHNVFLAGITPDQWAPVAKPFGLYLRVVLLSERIRLDPPGASLRDFVDEQNAAAPNSYDGGGLIVAYVRAEVRQ